MLKNFDSNQFSKIGKLSPVIQIMQLYVNVTFVCRFNSSASIDKSIDARIIVAIISSYTALFKISIIKKIYGTRRKFSGSRSSAI